MVLGHYLGKFANEMVKMVFWPILLFFTTFYCKIKLFLYFIHALKSNQLCKVLTIAD
jgi:hypothetical protein